MVEQGIFEGTSVEGYNLESLEIGQIKVTLNNLEMLT